MITTTPPSLPHRRKTCNDVMWISKEKQISILSKVNTKQTPFGLYYKENVGVNVKCYNILMLVLYWILYQCFLLFMYNHLPVSYCKPQPNTLSYLWFPLPLPLFEMQSIQQKSPRYSHWSLLKLFQRWSLNYPTDILIWDVNVGVKSQTRPSLTWWDHIFFLMIYHCQKF